LWLEVEEELTDSCAVWYVEEDDTDFGELRPFCSLTGASKWLAWVRSFIVANGDGLHLLMQFAVLMLRMK
jgi:hypothetical protein